VPVGEDLELWCPFCEPMSLCDPMASTVARNTLRWDLSPLTVARTPWPRTRATWRRAARRRWLTTTKRDDGSAGPQLELVQGCSTGQLASRTSGVPCDHGTSLSRRAGHRRFTSGAGGRNRYLSCFVRDPSLPTTHRDLEPLSLRASERHQLAIYSRVFANRNLWAGLETVIWRAPQDLVRTIDRDVAPRPGYRS